MKIDRKKIYEKYNGHCAYCGCEITKNEMQIDHINSKYRGGTDDIENLNPSCRACNFYKGVMTIEAFRNELNRLIERLNERVFIYRLARKFGLITETNNGVIFYFEKLRKEKR